MCGREDLENASVNQGPIPRNYPIGKAENKIERVSAKYIPHFFIDEQRERRLQKYFALQNQLKVVPELFSKITKVELWGYESTPKQSSNQASEK